MTPSQELFEIASQLEAAAAAIEDENLASPLKSLSEAAKHVGRSFGGSWLGYHSRVYYDGLQPVPPGAHFSQEWGLMDRGFAGLGSTGNWREYRFDHITSYIEGRAGDPDLTVAREASKRGSAAFDSSKSEIISILQTRLAKKSDSFLTKLLEEIEDLAPVSKTDVARQWSPKGQIATRDMTAMGQGNKVPPHVDILADIVAINHSFDICRAAAGIARKAASHVERAQKSEVSASRIGTNVFIGHGRSKVWREFKDFVQDRLGLPWDEFNRVPVAGITNIARLSEMLDAAAIAFLIMTAEDELADGAIQARMNVIHEVGLFQGRLGFTKAIVLIEEGCAEFSNIQGLGQIRFTKGNIGTAFEEIRLVLEREGLIS